VPAVALSRGGARGRIRSRRAGSGSEYVAAPGGIAGPAVPAGTDLPAGIGGGGRRQDLPGARRADGTRVHLLGAAEHGGRLLDHREIDVKHNETSHFAELLEPLDLAGAVVTFGALHTVRANLEWLAGEKKAHYIAVVKANQPLLHARLNWAGLSQLKAGDKVLTANMRLPG
jgi:hypothetical protein